MSGYVSPPKEGPEGMGPSRAESIPSNEDARFAISQFSGWITNADTKASLLATALTVLVGAVASQRNVLLGVLPTSGYREWTAVALFCSIVICIVGSVICLVRVLTPRVDRTAFSRYSWPAVAESPLVKLVSLSQQTEREEAWYTARVLAVIARVKFRNFSLALRWSIGAAGAFVAWLSVSP
jgi:uncharacterized membrane protein YeaQ/YmgE (transglycosylase-associated protein family)